MLLILCKKCGKFLAEGEQLWPVLVDQGAGLVQNMDVCQSCYETIGDETTQSKLLLEQA
jgi:hypothetical protein